MANISDILMQQAETSSRFKGVADEQNKLGTAYTELADIVGQTDAAVKADEARAAKIASDNRYQLARSVDADPNNANNVLNILGQSAVSGIKQIRAASDSIAAIENESFLDTPLKKLADTLFVLPGLERKKSMAIESTEDTLKQSQAINLLLQQDFQTYAAIGSVISDQQLKNKLESIGAKAGQEAMKEKFSGLAWQASSLELVDKATGSELKGLEAYYNQGSAEKLFKFNQEKFDSEKDYQGQTLDNAAKHLQLSTESVNRQNAQFDRVVAEDEVKRKVESEYVDSLRDTASKLGIPIKLDKPVIPANATPEEVAALTEQSNRVAKAQIDQMMKNSNLKPRVEAIMKIAAGYAGQTLEGIPKELQATIWDTTPWGAFNTVNSLGGLPVSVLPQEKLLNDFYRETYTDLSTNQRGILHSTQDRINTSNSRTSSSNDILSLGSSDSASSGNKETVAGSESTSVNSRYITPINAQNSAAENGAVFDQEIVAKAIDMGTNVESGGRNFYGMRGVAEWSQIGTINNSKLYQEVLKPLIAGGATGFTSAQLVQHALDAVDRKVLKRDDVAPTLAQFYQSMALQNNLVHNFAGHGFPAQQSWIVSQEDPVTGKFSKYNMMSEGSLSNFISVQEYLRNRGTVRRALDATGASNRALDAADHRHEVIHSIQHFVTGRE